MPSSVWLSHDKERKLHGFLEHLFSQVSQVNMVKREIICNPIPTVEFSCSLKYFRIILLVEGKNISVMNVYLFIKGNCLLKHSLFL